MTEDECGTKEGLKVTRESASGIGTFLAKNIEGRYVAADVEHEGKVIYKKGHFLLAPDAFADDTLAVELHDSSDNLLTTLATYSDKNRNATPSTYTKKSLTIPSKYNGHTVRLEFSGVSWSPWVTTFRIDEVAVQ